MTCFLVGGGDIHFFFTWLVGETWNFLRSHKGGTQKSRKKNMEIIQSPLDIMTTPLGRLFKMRGGKEGWEGANRDLKRRFSTPVQTVISGAFKGYWASNEWDPKLPPHPPGYAHTYPARVMISPALECWNHYFGYYFSIWCFLQHFHDRRFKHAWTCKKKLNKTKQKNKTKQNKTKQNKTKQNKKQNKQNKTKQNKNKTKQKHSTVAKSLLACAKGARAPHISSI